MSTEKRRAYMKQYDATHRPHANMRQRAINARTRAAAVAFLGGKCSRCGFTDVRALQIDHVLGGGSAAHKAGITAAMLSRDVLKTTSAGKYQLLCANCNWIKRSENGEAA